MTTDADTLPYDPDNVPYNKDPDDPGLSPVEKDIILALKGVYDPEIPVDIYELGLIYALKYNKKNRQDRHPHDPHRTRLPGGGRHARLGQRRGRSRRWRA